MIKNIPIKEFEHSITLRVLCDRLLDRQSRCYRDIFNHEELLTQSIFVANSLIKELHLSREMWVRKRGNKAFLFYEKNRRIIAEIAVMADKTPFGLSRPLFVLLNKKGFVKEKTIADLLIKFQNNHYRKTINI